MDSIIIKLMAKDSYHLYTKAIRNGKQLHFSNGAIVKIYHSGTIVPGGKHQESTLPVIERAKEIQMSQLLDNARPSSIILWNEDEEARKQDEGLLQDLKFRTFDKSHLCTECQNLLI